MMRRRLLSIIEKVTSAITLQLLHQLNSRISCSRATLSWVGDTIQAVSTVEGNYNIEVNIYPPTDQSLYIDEAVQHKITVKYTNAKPNTGNYLRTIVYFSNGTQSAGNASYIDNTITRNFTPPANVYITRLTIFISYTGSVTIGEIISIDDIIIERV